MNTPPKPKPLDDFMRTVQLHERAWGNEMYSGRPALNEILEARVVSLWYPVKADKHNRFKLRLFASTKEIEQHLTRLVFRSAIKSPEDRLARVFIDRKLHIVKAVRVLFEEVDTE